MEIKLNNFSCTAGMIDNQYMTSSERAQATHTTKAYELLLFNSKGSVVIGNETIAVENGVMVRLNPGETCRLPSRCRAHYLFVQEDGDVVTKNVMECPRSMRLRHPEQLLALIETMAMAEDKQDTYAVIVAMLGVSAFLDKELAPVRSTRKLTSKTMASVEKAVEYMDEHFREKCSLNEIAAYVGRSPIYFHDTFTEVVGKSPCDYVTDLRLGEAKRLLAFTNTEPADVAQQSGYGSQSYFNYAFKKSLGTTPLTYRRDAVLGYFKKK